MKRASDCNNNLALGPAGADLTLPGPVALAPHFGVRDRRPKVSVGFEKRVKQEAAGLIREGLGLVIHDSTMGDRMVTRQTGAGSRNGRRCLRTVPLVSYSSPFARLIRAFVLGIPLMSGCSELGPVSHIPPFARVPYEKFTRAAVVAIALREWRLFGAPFDDGSRPDDLKLEREDGLWQRVGEYWWLGLNRNAAEAGWTGKHDGQGKVFPPEDDGDYAWSAAFISYVMRIAGAGDAFPYAADHAVYINAAKRMTLGTDRGWMITAERPEDYSPVPGDLICHGRGRAASLKYDDLPTAELFPSHCDIVIDAPRPGVIRVLGGNVDDAVAMQLVAVSPEGRLARPDGMILDPKRNWMVVLRVLEPHERPVATAEIGVRERSLQPES